jgi:hypothetical protein
MFTVYSISSARSANSLLLRGIDSTINSVSMASYVNASSTVLRLPVEDI